VDFNALEIAYHDRAIAVDHFLVRVAEAVAIAHQEAHLIRGHVPCVVLDQQAYPWACAVTKFTVLAGVVSKKRWAVAGISSDRQVLDAISGMRYAAHGHAAPLQILVDHIVTLKLCFYAVSLRRLA
jgi:hypothetical protein